ncbi:general secretion pathway protein E [Dokdonella fugitiva]|uniref:Type II secretion system protein E n=1 Tax=Dokdonella fugitiva TaxID=328517 RepID=A0A839F618_9GAMM|nr:type II secretion system ATPase GspE [Dokdonella fugitiva]MBA8889512.1 general secretion pathway protein E [Dokdonella fugitiva]
MSEAARPARPSFGYARRHGVALTGWKDGAAEVACRVGVRNDALAELRRHLRAPLHFTTFAEKDFERLLRQLYEQGDDARAMVSDLDERMDLKALADELPEPEDLLESDDDAPIIRLINALLTEAVKEGASDIHIEPYENRLVVRFRIDGVLREVLSPQKAIASAVVSRIKVMAKLDIAERRLPQDGRIGLRIAGRPVDVRVSTIPAGRGERVVLRLLDKQAGKLDLVQLGMDDAVRAKLEDLIARPHGILLVTGPTGSGKTTTLYGALLKLNDASRNIMTVEDPIEYYIDGVGQTQVNTRVDMTFARGLRAILRQDPDVVMVGEIRDLETAEVAVQASLTGHLVLSTLHTNSAIGAVTRLRDMGVEPFLLSSSLIGVLAQRLVRVLDPATREAYAATPAELAAFGKPADLQATLYRPRADLAAQGRASGYKGRTGIYELVALDDALRRLVHEGASEADLERHARTRSASILEDGWRKCVAGITSTEEVLRVTREE